MSYRTWTTYGYGIRVDDIFPIARENIWQLLDLAPKTKKKFIDFLLDNNYGDEIEFCDILLDYEDDYGNTGLGALLQEVIWEAENLGLCVCCDYNGIQYLLYTPDYPWNFHKDRDLKEEDVVRAISRCVNSLTNKPVTIDYYECENGG